MEDEGIEITKKTLNKHDFFFETPLYEAVPVDELEEAVFSGEIDAYSAKNNSDTTYSVGSIRVHNWGNPWRNKRENDFIYTGYYLVILTCKRKNDDVLRFFIYIDKEKVMKVGQSPSLADLQFSEIGKKYNKVLPEEDLKNLKKAIGLVSHGAGAGSFVYLRKIFENLIWETYYNNNLSAVVDENTFKFFRMEEKIDVLKLYLPSQLVEMKSIYGILSKGVHELDEEECLKYFAPLKLSIELILDQKIEEEIKNERDEAVKKQLQSIHQELSKPQEKKK